MKIEIFGAQLEVGLKKPGKGVVPTAGSWRPLPAMATLRSTSTLTADAVASAVTLSEYGNASQLLGLYRDLLVDSHILAEYQKRLLAVLGDPLQVGPKDEESAEDKRAAEAVTLMIEECENWWDGLAHLMRSTLWPVAVAEKIYRPAPSGSGLSYLLDRLEPVDDRVLDLRPRKPNEIYLTAENAENTERAKAIWEPQVRLYPVDGDGGVGSESGVLDPMRHLVHRGHVLLLPDCWGGPMRSILFWWLLGTMDRQWWGRYLEKYGTPFLVGHTDVSDRASVSLLEQAFALAVKLGGIVVDHATQVELKEAAAQSTGEAFEKFHATCKREISKLIVGQELSATASGTGLGSGVANLQGQVREDIRRFDQQRLGGTLERQVFRPFLEINGLRGRVRLIWGAEGGDEAKQTAEILSGLNAAGLRPADEALPAISKKVGFQVERKEEVGQWVSGSVGQRRAPEVTGFAANIEHRTPNIERRTDDPVDAVAARKAAALATAFRGSLAPVREIIMSSGSEAEALRRLRAFYADWKPERAQAVLEEALQVCAASALSRETRETR